MTNSIENKNGKRLANQAIQSIIDSGGLDLFLYLIENVSGDEFFKQGFYSQVAELAARGIESKLVQE